MSKRWIKKGLSVVTITDLDTSLVVEKIVFQTKKIGNQNISRIVGVECYHRVNGKKNISMVHSKELIPLSIAQKGKSECYKFINREGEYSDY